MGTLRLFYSNAVCKDIHSLPVQDVMSNTVLCVMSGCQSPNYHDMLLSTAIIPSVVVAHQFVDLQDDATVESLSAQDKHCDKHGWAHRIYTWLFEGDLFAGVASDSMLMRIHSTAEEFDQAAEETLIPFQVPYILQHCECYIAASNCTATLQTMTPHRV